jgi:hypothetical protein
LALPTTFGAKQSCDMIRKVLKILLFSFVAWLISVITGLAVFVFIPQQSQWFWPAIIAWFIVSGALSLIVLVMWVRLFLNWRKSSNPVRHN